MRRINPTGEQPDSGIPVLDVIFIHGLGGHVTETWQANEDSFWPQWLADSFKQCRVFLASYDSTKLARILSGDGASIQDIAQILADQLISRETQAKNTLFVCHSLGGLIAKQIIRKCEDSVDSDFNDLGRSVRGMVFLGTPHQGAQFATVIDSILRDFTSKQTKQLAYSSEALLELNEFFRNCANKRDILVKSFYETEKTWGIHVVDKVTGNPGVLGSEPIAVQCDHKNICKPKDRDAPVFTSVCATVRKLLSKICPTSQAGNGSSGLEADTIANGTWDLKDSESKIGFSPEVQADFEYFTKLADSDRRDLKQKLDDAGRGYLFRDARRKKERFAKELRSRIAQPSAVTRFTKLLSDVEARYNRHVARVIAESGCAKDIDQEIQEQVIEPCLKGHSSPEHEITAGHVDGALYYLAGNCHLAWDND
ncbi:MULTISPECIES: ABC-three component system protein [unclassified Ruegeria]|uniref:ABC-three component system protein n=1 Tax=unclassified Ruegeria TaxID=2625375 RepID=UPI001ADB066A|nr:MULTISPECIES: ABC-three component system protein [unclassified Ruegeria]MBO9411766.1 hypothetical protein [Ruegeria sp. R8_1]MBO9415673.1 hypothetical protein [Ruegeria sp. R8_2]